MKKSRRFSQISTYSLLVVFSLVALLGGVYSQSKETQKVSELAVKVKSKKVSFPAKPTIVSGVIIAPAEALVKAMGAKYKYASKTRTITITKSDTTIVLKLDSKTAKVNGKSSTMPVAAKLIKVPFVPVKFIGGKLGYTKYSYDSKKKVVSLNTPVRKTHIFVAGDSTAASYEPSIFPRTGWGQVLNKFFDKDIVVVNYALSGESSKSFVEIGYLDAILYEIKAGDYMFISFGHNDEKIEKPDYYTEPNTTYKEYLTKYINGARAKKAIPVLITPVARRLFDENGKIPNSHGDYPAAMIELGNELNVPVIDLNSKSTALIESFGVEGSKELFMGFKAGKEEDNTHFTLDGATEIAKLIIEGVKEADISKLVTHIVP